MNSYNVHLIERNISRYGKVYTFFRSVKNKFGEETSETAEIHRLRGIYHNSRGGYSAVKISEETAVREKRQPMILCMFSDTDKLREGDSVSFGGRTYRITAIDDVEVQGEVAEISLEAIV